MKIQEVTIEGYQSHTNSTFRLSPGLTVITGPSDAGKTAIIRALRWFAFNEPTGEAFLHTIRNPDGSIKEAVDQVKVSVTFDNGITITKTRIHITRNLEDLQADLKEVETDVIRYDALLGFQYGYINLQETIRRTSALVVKLDQAVGLSFMLDEAEKDTQALEALERAYKRFNEVSHVCK